MRISEPTKDGDARRNAARRRYPTLRDLYPRKSEDWYERAEKYLRQYFLSARRQYERIKADPKAYAAFKKLLEDKRRQEGESESSK